ncbi:MAG: DUF58 domain-containing protein [Vulcanisaeta sp. AZ3]|jgi:uncharacterized protein (DUF58 family)|nr:MAG: hypothetical protein TU36_04615 [Vulcanisaeta sp. AZ3]
MIHVELSDKLLIIYVAISSVTYAGLLMSNAFGVYFGLALFLVFTSYVMAWYLIANLVLVHSQISFDQDRVEVMWGARASLGVSVFSRIPIKLMASLILIHPPHVVSEERVVIINGGYSSVDMIGRWIGEVRIIGGVVIIREPMGLMTIEGLLLSDGINVVINPAPRGMDMSVGSMGFGEHGISMEGRLGDFTYFMEYDYERPASSIHWITTARINELMMIRRNEYGSCPTIILNSSSRMLMPNNGNRPIDNALQIISEVTKYCPEVKVILISKGYVEQRTISRGLIPNLERDIRIRVLSNNPNNVTINIPRHFMKFIDPNELYPLAYIRGVVDDEPTATELNKAYAIVGSKKQALLLGLSKEGQ